MKRCLTLTFLYLLLTADLPAQFTQRVGLPSVHNYPHAEYGAGTQNWAVTQAAKGKMYFANNSGLVEFDGMHWKLYSSEPIIYRSVCAVGDTVYVGGYDEFGYYAPDETGMLRYTSLRSLVQGRPFEIDDIWRIHATRFGVVFQSFNGIFLYDSGAVRTILPQKQFHFSFRVNDNLYVFDEEGGLLQFGDEGLVPLPGGDAFIGKQVWGIQSVGMNRLVVGTAKEGLFISEGNRFIPWNVPVNELLKKYQIFSMTVVKGEYLAFGTIQNGLIITDIQGLIVMEINKTKGLQNNTVLSLSPDGCDNIWLGLDNGISLVKFNSPLTFISGYFDVGSGYTSRKYGDLLYLGTNQGLFYIPWNDFVDPLKSKDDFHLIEGTEGQVWDLEEVDGTLLCGHNYGVFQVNGTSARKVSDIPGGWCFLKPADRSDLLLVGTYTGISVLERTGANWYFRNVAEGYHYSSRFFRQDADRSFWVSHSYEGVIRLMFDPEFRTVADFRIYGKKDGLPEDRNNVLFSVNRELVIATRQGLYQYTTGADIFQPFPHAWSNFLNSGKTVDYLCEDPNRNIWYISNATLSVLRFHEDGTYKKVSTPFTELRGQLIGNYGHVEVIDRHNALIGMEGGFAHYNSNYVTDYSKSPTLYITSITSRDSTESTYAWSSAQAGQQTIPAFRYLNNLITIQFAANDFAAHDPEFQYRLEGFDTEWSELTDVSSKEYTNLKEGTYTFKLRYLMANGSFSPELAYVFRILPPWYRTVYAQAGMVIIGLVLLFLFYKLTLSIAERRKEEENRQREINIRNYELKLKEEALLNEQENARLRNEKLNMEVIQKEKELANSTMMLINKNEMLNDLKSHLKQLSKETTDQQMRDELKKMMWQLTREIDSSKQWQVFDTHIEQVHEDFLNRLKQKHPLLNTRELRLATFVKMDLPSKEIASLMNISTRGVEIARYRLRKRLGIERTDNLNEYLNQL